MILVSPICDGADMYLMRPKQAYRVLWILVIRMPCLGHGSRQRVHRVLSTYPLEFGSFMSTVL